MELQKLLNQNLTPIPNLPGTIQFGPKTENAVLAFQRKFSLVADGIVGPKTWAALKNKAQQLLTGKPKGISQAARKRIKEFECRVLHMYLDSEGYVTVGIGHMLPTASAASKLPFVRVRHHRQDKNIGQSSQKRPIQSQEQFRLGIAHKQEIEEEFQLLKSSNYLRMINGRSQTKYTSLEISEKTAEQLFEEDIRKALAWIIKRFPQWNSFPESARDGIFDMAFNMGENRFSRAKWPRFYAAVDSQNWEAAARECRRNNAGLEKRNRTVKADFLKAAALGRSTIHRTA